MAWVTYYRCEWLKCLRSAIGLTPTPGSALIPAERAPLVRSYAGLLAAVHRA